MTANLDDSTPATNRNLHEQSSCDSSLLNMTSPLKKSLLKEPTTFHKPRYQAAARHVLLTLEKKK